MNRSQQTTKWKRKIKLAILPLAFLLAFLLSLIFDSRILTAIQSARTSQLDAFFSILLFIENGFIFYPLIVALTLAILLAAKKKKRIFPYIVSAAAVALLTLFLKWLVARPRPNLTSDASFPSGHASFIFASLPFFSKALKTIWLVLACLLSFTRVWFSLHYLSDVIFGAALGFYLPSLIDFLLKRKK